MIIIINHKLKCNSLIVLLCFMSELLDCPLLDILVSTVTAASLWPYASTFAIENLTNTLHCSTLSGAGYIKFKYGRNL